MAGALPLPDPAEPKAHPGFVFFQTHTAAISSGVDVRRQFLPLADPPRFAPWPS
jgi:hypothetical protein